MYEDTEQQKKKKKKKKPKELHLTSMKQNSRPDEIL